MPKSILGKWCYVDKSQTYGRGNRGDLNITPRGLLDLHLREAMAVRIPGSHLKGLATVIYPSRREPRSRPTSRAVVVDPFGRRSPPTMFGLAPSGSNTTALFSLPP